MARPKEKTSKRSFGNIGLKPEEDEKLIEMLTERDLTLRRLQRALIRQWVREGGDGGRLKYTK